MKCELCGSEIGDAAFGDVDGAIVCPRCLGHVPGVEMDSEVAEFYRREREKEITYVSEDEENALLQESEFLDECSRREV